MHCVCPKLWPIFLPILAINHVWSENGLNWSQNIEILIESDGLNRTFEHGTDLSLDNTREYGDKDHEMAF